MGTLLNELIRDGILFTSNKGCSIHISGPSVQSGNMGGDADA